MYVTEQFHLPESVKINARNIDPCFGYNGFSEYLFYKHYSRVKYLDGIPYGQEDWWDACIRVIEGTFSIRKTHYIKNRIVWDETSMQDLAEDMLYSLVRMQWLMGRGLWAMGTEQVNTRGGMALYNCAYCEVGTDWINALCWAMDSSMHGVGVGFGIKEHGLFLRTPVTTHELIVGDSKEGWVDLLRQTLNAFTESGSLPIPNVNGVRPKGSAIRTFGGVASGPEPLLKMYNWIVDRCYEYCNGLIDEVTLKADIANMIGVCVVSGNVRRSAEILVADLFEENLSGDGAELNETFLQLRKDPDRANWSWMSNNSVRLRQDPCFEELPKIARLNTLGYDVGYLNMQTFPFPRLGRGMDGMREDKATGINPCGEVPLEDREVCNLAETCPTRCTTVHDWYRAVCYATFYTQTVSLLPTHSPETNTVIARNRRIGVSIMDFVNWKQEHGTAAVTKYLRYAYDMVRTYAAELAAEAGVPAPIRHTVVKPGGTTPKLAGRGSGASHPTFRLIRRRVRVGYHEPMYTVLHNAGVQEEADINDPSCACFSFPIDMSSCPPATEVSIWEQAMNIVLLQREWADNAVSNTLYYRPRWICVGKGSLEHYAGDKWESLEYGIGPYNMVHFKEDGKEHTFKDRGKIVKIWFNDNEYLIYLEQANHEEDQLEAVLAAIAPHTKSVSLLPHSPKGLFPQMPEEELSRDEYNQMVATQPKLKWDGYICESEEIKYCEGDKCVITR